MVHLLANEGEADWGTCWSSVQDFVATDWHENIACNMVSKLGGDLGNLKLCINGLVSLHVKALGSDGSVNLCDKCSVETVNDSDRDEDASGIELKNEIYSRAGK